MARHSQPSRQSDGAASIYPTGIPLWLLARILMAHLKRRSKYLPAATFEDPQWSMMLDLFVASEEGRQMSISSLSLASGVPPTTALRHIRSLVANGLFERISHPQDRRICLVRLSREGRNQMIAYLASIAAAGIEVDD